MARKSPAFSFYPDSWVLGTIAMTFEEQGLYLRMLCFQWSHGPGNANAYANACGLAYVEHCQRILETKFICIDGLWQNERLEVERLKQVDRSSKSQEAAKRRWNTEKSTKMSGKMSVKTEAKPDVDECLGNANAYANAYAPAMPSVSVSVSSINNNIHKPSKDVFVGKPEDVDAKTWDTLLANRKAKRQGKVSEIALAGMRREAAKSGLTLQAALTVACEKTWCSFDSKWYDSLKAASGGQSTAKKLESSIMDLYANAKAEESAEVQAKMKLIRGDE